MLRQHELTLFWPYRSACQCGCQWWSQEPGYRTVSGTQLKQTGQETLSRSHENALTRRRFGCLVFIHTYWSRELDRTHTACSRLSPRCRRSSTSSSSCWRTARSHTCRCSFGNTHSSSCLHHKEVDSAFNSKAKSQHLEMFTLLIGVFFLCLFRYGNYFLEGVSHSPIQLFPPLTCMYSAGHTQV